MCETSTNQTCSTYESRAGPFSPSLSGDSLKGQVIPTCFLHAIRPEKNLCEDISIRGLATKPDKMGGGEEGGIAT